MVATRPCYGWGAGRDGLGGRGGWQGGREGGRKGRYGWMHVYLVFGLDVKLDLLAGQGADSRGLPVLVCEK